jgi:1-deoxy-D-xylulose-5-phosphate reductoisomerase
VLEGARAGAAATIAVNAADEIAVSRFLRGELAFNRIASVLERALVLASRVSIGVAPDLATILAFDRDVRDELAAAAVA